MRVAVYFPSNNVEHQQTLMAFVQGVREVGDECLTFMLEDFDGYTYDTAVIYGVGKGAVKYSAYREHVRRVYESHGKRALVLEKGYIARDKYYAAGWDHINGRATFLNVNKPADRWLELNTPLSDPCPNPEGHILLVGQVPWDASVEKLDHAGWLFNAAQVLRAHSRRRILFRPHPLSANAIASVPYAQTVQGELSDALSGAWAVVTHSSNTGVEALIAGKHVWAGDKGSMVWSIANRELARIESPLPFPERQQWANDLAYAQWTWTEMASGEAWRHLRPGVSMPTCGQERVEGAPHINLSVGSAPNIGEPN